MKTDGSDKQNQVATQENNNPFAIEQKAERQYTGSVEAVESNRSIAEVQASMAIAKRFPRDNMQAMERILTECRRPTLAEQAVYSYPRGGQQVTGPSIRLAEAIARQWGNMNFGLKILSTDKDKTSVLAYAWDLETNTRSEKVFDVKHERTTRQGSYKLEDQRDIYEMVANYGARRLRNCILSIVPGDVIEAAIKETESTLQYSMEAPQDQLKRMLEAFLQYGVTKAAIEKRVGHKLEAESTIKAELLNLRKIYNSIKDGYSKPEDWFVVEKKMSSKQAPE